MLNSQEGPKLPNRLHQLSIEDPQSAISYLYERKNHYKRMAANVKHENQVLKHKLLESSSELSSEKKKVIKITKKAQYWRNESMKESTAKKYWSYACLFISFVLITILIVTITVNQLVAPGRVNVSNSPKGDLSTIPTSGMMQNTPGYVLASVNIYNGSIQGSGTIISKGDKYSLLLSAAHNFVGKIGGEFWVYYPDGTYTSATLLALDRTRDLALASVDVNTVIASSYVPSKDSLKGIITGVGYTNGQGPNLRYLSYEGYHKSSYNRILWKFGIQKGPFWDGDSGGGIFINDGLVGVTSQRTKHLDQSTQKVSMFAVSHAEIIEFLTENAKDKSDYGDWSTPTESYVASDGPPLWNPNPNIPIHTERFSNQELDVMKQDVEKIKHDLKVLSNKIGEDNIKPEPSHDDLLRHPSDVD